MSHMTHFAIIHYTFKAVLTKLPGKMDEEVGKELYQIHINNVLINNWEEKLIPFQYKRSLDSTITINKKCNVSIKCYFCANGRKPRDIIPKQDSTSLTICLDYTVITADINGHKHQEMSVVDLLGVYMSAKSDELVHIVLRGDFYMLTATMDPQTYS